MRRWIGLLAGAGLLSWVLISPPFQAAQAAPVTPGLAVSVAPRELVPGQAGAVTVSGGYPLGVSVSLDSQPLDVFWTGSGYEALFSFGLEDPPGKHALSISAHDPISGATLSQTTEVKVTPYGFGDEQVLIPSRLYPLLDPKLNQSEIDRLEKVYTGRTRPASFNWPFLVPVPGGIVTSRFGANRVYNGGLLATRHTGMDFRRQIGEPVQATADGRVVLAEHLDIRGNVIIIDHGYGVFSQYAHLSQILVQPGDAIRRGQIIGLAGATGRTNGPHLHFEIIVNGNPVDPMKWLALAPGFIPPPVATPRPQDTPSPQP